MWGLEVVPAITYCNAGPVVAQAEWRLTIWHVQSNTCMPSLKGLDIYRRVSISEVIYLDLGLPKKIIRGNFVKSTFGFVHCCHDVRCLLNLKDFS